MNVLWITLALLTAGFAGWPVTALVFRLARTIDDRQDSNAGADPANDPSADATVDSSPAVGATPAAPATPGATGASGADVAAPAGGSAAGSAPGSAAAAVSSVRILRGGAIIGVLERVAVCLAVLAGEPVAIAYVIAIKGLGRFAELKETPVAAERFIIGTLTSLLWAAGVAVLARVLVLG